MAGTLARRELVPTPSNSVTANALAYAVASSKDEADLRALLRESPMAGAVRLCFTREPNYFFDGPVLGAEELTITARRAGKLVCMGHNVTRRLTVDGEAQRVGYLGELRLRTGERGGARFLRQGYRFFREQISSAPAAGYFTSIAADNTRARAVLERGTRLGLPEYRFLTRLTTCVAPVKSRNLSESTATETCVSFDALAEFMRRKASTQQLALPWDDTTWSELQRVGLSWRDFEVIERNGRIVAAAAVWDQRAFRQTVIAGYGPWFRALRPLINLWQSLRGFPVLPAPQERLEQVFVLGRMVETEDTWPELYGRLVRRAARLGANWLVWSADAREAKGQKRFLSAGTRLYSSRLYSVSWDGNRGRPALGVERLFGPEVALL